MRPDLVTGATGFIGRHLARRLVKSQRPLRVLCRPTSEEKLPSEILGRAEVVYGDLANRESLRRAVHGIGRVFHCAGRALDWGTKEEFLTANVDGLRWLLAAAAGEKVDRFVHLSSFVVFGTPAPPYFDDNSPYGPSSDPYSRTKVEGERTAFSVSAESGLALTVLRPTVVYGLEGKWLEEPLRMMKRHLMFLVGGGAGTCHPCYVENLVDAMLLAADHPNAVGRAYLVADDDPVTFREYFDAVASIAGERVVRRSVPLPIARLLATGMEGVARALHSRERPLLTRAALAFTTPRSRMSMNRIREELGYEPRYRFGQAIEELRARYHNSHG